MLVALVDYGAGNLTSVRKALRAVGADVFTPAAPPDLFRADAIVIPGVGHFSATAALDTAWRGAVGAALADGRPLLGICLGLQWLFDGSSEAPHLPGLGVFGGLCQRLDQMSGTDEGKAGLKVPHVGWNEVTITRPSVLLAGLPPDAQAYFTHSYAAPVTEATIATTTHGAVFASAVARGRVLGVQFHPEKSGDDGLAVLANFIRIAQGG